MGRWSVSPGERSVPLKPCMRVCGVAWLAMAGPTSTSRLRYLSAGDREFVRETLVAVRTHTTATAQNPGGLSPR